MVNLCFCFSYKNFWAPTFCNSFLSPFTIQYSKFFKNSSECMRPETTAWEPFFRKTVFMSTPSPFTTEHLRSSRFPSLYPMGRGFSFVAQLHNSLKSQVFVQKVRHRRSRDVACPFERGRAASERRPSTIRRRAQIPSNKLWLLWLEAICCCCWHTKVVFLNPTQARSGSIALRSVWCNVFFLLASPCILGASLQFLWFMTVYQRCCRSSLRALNKLKRAATHHWTEW